VPERRFDRRIERKNWIMDNFDDLLTPTAVSANDAIRDELRRLTSGMIRRRRWRGHVRRGLALAACFVAGIGAHWLWQSRMPVPTPTPGPETVVQVSPTPPQKPEMIRAEPPDRTERWAAQATNVERRVELYRKAGDEYLVRGDEISALRCYRKSLDSSRPTDLVVNPERDNWLLMSLKIARQKETNDARN
jgi:hypothetical protein